MLGRRGIAGNTSDLLHEANVIEGRASAACLRRGKSGLLARRTGVQPEERPCGWNGGRDCGRRGGLGEHLIGGCFRDANLEGANLESVMLGQAHFDGANLSNAIWTDGHKCPPGTTGDRC
jgi:uncharacterized protein YjbI with pentapeptide repeats